MASFKASFQSGKPRLKVWLNKSQFKAEKSGRRAGVGKSSQSVPEQLPGMLLRGEV
jgi:hypothetical protein